jgi:outer membrane protein TolC
MTTRALRIAILGAIIVAILVCAGHSALLAQSQVAQSPRLITMREALDLALEHNHRVRMARSSVDEKQHVKEVARSAYFPSVRTDSSVVHLTDTQLIEIPAGGLGAVSGNLIPARDITINQGALTATTLGTGIVQPLTQLFKIRAANDVARADLQATSGRLRAIENSVALKVHQLYYRILIVDVQRSAVRAKLEASENLRTERVQQVRYGSALDADLIESRAQSLQAKQELLSADLELSDLQMQFNDVVGLPLNTAVVLDPNVALTPQSCERDDCVALALASHPELAEARAQVDKASAAVRLAKYEFVPDVEVFARYSYQNNVPFLAQNFATVGVHLRYDLFEGGRRRAAIRERNAQLAQAQENVARIVDEVELRVQTAYNKLERTQQMVAVSEELLSLRRESRRVATELVVHGGALRSQAQASVAQELEARAILLRSQLDFVQAVDEMNEAIGRPPQ